MFFYFLIIRIAALFGHRKARLMVQGQKEIKDAMTNKGQGTKDNVLGTKRLADFRGAVWIHVSSVGEFEQARPLIEHLKMKKEKVKIILTFFSPSGYGMRKNYDKVDAVFYLPFATRRNAKRFLNTLQPKMAIFVKYEFWPAYLRELKKRQIRTYSISAIFREKQLFFRWYGKWYLKLLRCFTHIYVQDENSLVLLEKHGIHNATIVGDTRFDRVQEVKANSEKANDGRLTPVAQFVEGCERVIVAGSTWPKDEVLLAQYLKAQNDHGQSTKLILVPHEIDENHLHFIFNLFQGRFVRYTRATQTSLLYANVMVMDTMGLLSSIYRFGQVAYIGGGFGVGIHNTIEAAVYGVPVIFGPNYQHFREAKGLIAAGAARSIKDYPEIEAALDTALAQHETIGVKAAEYVAAETGATEKIYNEIFNS